MSIYSFAHLLRKCYNLKSRSQRAFCTPKTHATTCFEAIKYILFTLCIYKREQTQGDKKMSIGFQAGLGASRGVQSNHSGGARTQGNHGGAHRNESIFNQKPDFSRNHGRNYGFEFDKNEGAQGHNRHHRLGGHGGSDRFAEVAPPPKHKSGGWLGGLIGLVVAGPLGALAGVLIGNGSDKSLNKQERQEYNQIYNSHKDNGNRR